MAVLKAKFERWEVQPVAGRRLEAKLDVLARAIGGDGLVCAWEELEAKDGIPERRRTFTRARVRRAKAG